MNFDFFYLCYTKYLSNVKPDPKFLEWLIGFVEGDGSFVISKRGDLSFVIVQSTEDVKILYYIKEQLGFGQVYQQSKSNKTHRFVIQDFKSLYLICALFNGNFVFPTRNVRFIKFLANLNEKLIKRNYKDYSIILPNYNTIKPSLKDAWLSGITDAEGCFTVSFLTRKDIYRIRYILSQKWEINKEVLISILNLFSNKIGEVYIHSNPISNVYELRVNGVKNCIQLIEYFEEYQLKTKKLESYKKWKYILFALERKEHINLENRENLKTLSKFIN